MLTPRLEWLPTLSAHNDARWLAQWRAARPTYQRGDELDGLRWKDDRHTRSLNPAAPRALFDRAAERLLRYDFYPPTMLTHTSEFVRQNRRLRLGELIVQRIHAVPGLLDVVTATRVSEVIDEPRRQGFAYVATQAHFEIGEWWCWLAWQPEGELTVHIRSISRAGPRLPRWQRGYARRLQLRAHAAGLARFAALVAAS
ncbi:MAG: DUF1990 family protein [Anaerolineales bacterium]